MKKLLTLCTTLFIFIFGVFYPFEAFAQKNFAVLFNGESLLGNPKLISKQTDMKLFGEEGKIIYLDFSELEADTPIFPGVEIKFNQDGRISFGLGYQYWKLGKDPLFLQAHNTEGETVFSCTQINKANIDMAIGTLYVNILKKGAVRPFIGAGIGASSINATIIQQDKKHSEAYFELLLPSHFSGQYPHGWIEWMEKIKEKDKTPDIYKSRDWREAIRGIVGVNIYPKERFFLSIGGGWLNGYSVNFGIGVTF